MSSTHGHASGSKFNPTYTVWRSMVNRCTQSSSTCYKHYGGRGISVCDHWRKYANFLADMGERPTDNHSIERINVNGNYERSNCCWLPKELQARNRRNTVRLADHTPAVAYAEETGVKQKTMVHRVNEGFSEHLLGYTGGQVRQESDLIIDVDNEILTPRSYYRKHPETPRTTVREYLERDGMLLSEAVKKARSKDRKHNVKDPVRIGGKDYSGFQACQLLGIPQTTIKNHVYRHKITWAEAIYKYLDKLPY